MRPPQLLIGGGPASDTQAQRQASTAVKYGMLPAGPSNMQTGTMFGSNKAPLGFLPTPEFGQAQASWSDVVKNTERLKAISAASSSLSDGLSTQAVDTPVRGAVRLDASPLPLEYDSLSSSSSSFPLGSSFSPWNHSQMVSHSKFVLSFWG